MPVVGQPVLLTRLNLPHSVITDEIMAVETIAVAFPAEFSIASVFP